MSVNSVGDVEADQPAAVGQAARDRQRRQPVNVPTSTATCASDQPGQQREQRGLLGRDLHPGVVGQHPAGLLDQRAGHLVGVRVVRDDVGVQVVGQRERSEGHDRTLCRCRECHGS